MVHTVRLHAYMPFLLVFVSSSLLLSPIFLSLSLSRHPSPTHFPSGALRAFSPLLSPPFSYSSLFTIFLSDSARVSESRPLHPRALKSRVHSVIERNFLAACSQRSARAHSVRLSRGLIKNNFSYLHRGTSSLVCALPDSTTRL